MTKCYVPTREAIDKRQRLERLLRQSASLRKSEGTALYLGALLVFAVSMGFVLGLVFGHGF
jgi:hypothetical protein